MTARTRTEETKPEAPEAKTTPAAPAESIDQGAEQGQTAADAERQRRIEAGECVVDDGTPHTGRAVNGQVCSAHAISHRADGTARGW